jgi:hypothetical protein
VGNREKYGGAWKDGKHNGKGTNTFPNGNELVGERNDDKTLGKQHGELPAHSSEKNQMLQADNESIKALID